MTSATLFQKEWVTYRKIVDNNYLYHREAYSVLRNLALAKHSRFSFLDLACGDAGSTADALKGTSVTNYVGVDLSTDALRLAEVNLRPLGCSIELIHGDLAEILMACSRQFDVVWTGLSLHHFTAPQKLGLMREARRITRDGDLLVLYENTLLEDETREDWLMRWDGQRPGWDALTAGEWEAVTRHVHEHDFPESDSDWRELGSAAGYRKADQLFLSPTKLFRLYAFQA